jgi:hypothetical protein
MVIRHARLIALLLVATIAASALASVLWLGADAPFLTVRGKSVLDTRQAALACIGYATLLSLIFDRAARVRRWRRNIVRAGGAFATGWIGVLALILLAQGIAWAQALGHPIAREPALATAAALLVLAKANFLTKSRPAWLNGTTLPLFACDPIVWRRVHRASALRLTAIGVAIILCVILLPAGPALRPIITWLLAIEVGLATLHGLWLGGPSWARRASA